MIYSLCHFAAPCCQYAVLARLYALNRAGRASADHGREVDHPTAWPLPQRAPARPEPSPRRARRLPRTRRRWTHHLALPQLRRCGVRATFEHALHSPARAGAPQDQHAQLQQLVAVILLGWRAALRQFRSCPYGPAPIRLCAAPALNPQRIAQNDAVYAGNLEIVAPEVLVLHTSETPTTTAAILVSIPPRRSLTRRRSRPRHNRRVRRRSLRRRRSWLPRPHSLRKAAQATAAVPASVVRASGARRSRRPQASPSGTLSPFGPPSPRCRRKVLDLAPVMDPAWIRRQHNDTREEKYVTSLARALEWGFRDRPHSGR